MIISWGGPSSSTVHALLGQAMFCDKRVGNIRREKFTYKLHVLGFFKFRHWLVNWCLSPNFGSMSALSPTLAVFQLYLQLWQYFSFISNFGSISALSPTLAVFQLYLQLWQYFSFIVNKFYFNLRPT